MSVETLLQVQDLSIDFGTPRGRLHALRGINLDVPHGRIKGLVGESGCGKSTLAYSLSGYWPAMARWRVARSCWMAWTSPK